MRTRKPRKLKIKAWKKVNTDICICGASSEFGVQLTGRDRTYYPMCPSCLIDRLTTPDQYLLTYESVFVQYFKGETEQRNIQIDY